MTWPAFFGWTAAAMTLLVNADAPLDWFAGGMAVLTALACLVVAIQGMK